MRSLLFGHAARCAVVYRRVGGVRSRANAILRLRRCWMPTRWWHDAESSARRLADTATIQDSDSLRLLARYYRDSTVDSSVAITWATRDANIVTIGATGVVVASSAEQRASLQAAAGKSTAPGSRSFSGLSRASAFSRRRRRSIRSRRFSSPQQLSTRGDARFRVAPWHGHRPIQQLRRRRRLDSLGASRP